MHRYVRVFFVKPSGNPRSFAERIPYGDNGFIVLIRKHCRAALERTNGHVIIPKPRFGIDVYPFVLFENVPYEVIEFSKHRTVFGDRHYSGKREPTAKTRINNLAPSRNVGQTHTHRRAKRYVVP